ncbi:Translation initiation factor IF-3 [bioreactor metagenome]|uniref:Translation initiation factor IF-3 n=1 Tax=bioreactor metagenome TaxID=1076179 RepID=A0A645E7Z9_9ZZZZ
MSSFRNKTQNQKFYKINQYINAPEVRLLDDQGKQIGVVSISEARHQSMETGLDLVEVNGSAKPPVVKLISFSKFKYQESKKLQAEKKGIKGGELKEIQMTPFIGQNDYQTRVDKAKRFFTTGNKVKLSIKFQGRQVAHQEFGTNIVEKFKTDLQEFATPEGEAKLIGKRLMITFTPSKKKATN